MLEERLGELEERLRTAPGDLDLLCELCHLALQTGRLPGFLRRDEHLAPLDELWRARPDDRSLVGVVLPLLGLERVTGDERRPGLWWSQELRLAEAEDHFYDPVSGWPLVVRRVRDGALMHYVPEGSFLAGDQAHLSLEPRREERTGAFLLDRHEVTVGRFRHFLAATGAAHPQYQALHDPFHRDQLPAQWISFHDAEAYAAWVGARLPDALEWEKAARGTDGRTFPWGDELPDRRLANWFWDEGQGDRYAFMDHRPQAVGSYPAGASPFGLLDMAGNLCEWCRDRVDFDAAEEFRGVVEAGEGPLHPVRGGCYHDFSSSELAVAGGRPGRACPETTRSATVGFRLAIPLP